MPNAPLVTALVAVHDGEEYVRAALASILGQTVTDLEVVVVDDASADATPEILASVDDTRLRVLRNGEQLGLAGSLNRGLDDARGTYVARLDADDVAMPRRLERQLARIHAAPPAAVVGSAVLELDAGRVGTLHAMPVGATDVRWAALFSSPFFHPTVLVEREVLERHALRYDTSFEESEDYDLWSRLLDVAEGDNLPDPLVLYRVHPEQASQRRRELQRECQLRVARRMIGGVAPALSSTEVELVWRIGVGVRIAPDDVDAAVDAYLRLVDAFEHRAGPDFRPRAARDLVRVAQCRLRHGTRTDHAAMHSGSTRGFRRTSSADDAHAATPARARREAEGWLRRLAAPTDPQPPIRVAAVFPEPTPYRAPLLDRIAAHGEVDLTVVYAAGTVAGRTWRVEPNHHAVFLRGLRIPGAQRILHHDYPVTPGVVPRSPGSGPPWSSSRAGAPSPPRLRSRGAA